MEFQKNKKYDVFGIGNPLIDFLVQIDEDEFLNFNLAKGTCTVMEEDEIEKISSQLEKYEFTKSPGDATANTITTLGKLGANVVYAGKVGNDEYGLYYEQDLIASKVKPNLNKHAKKTGKAIALVTPDTERTFAVNLGAAYHLEKEDLFEEDLKNSKILHLTGYQLDNETIRSTCLHAIKIAKENNVKVSIDLADINMINSNKEIMKEIIKDADIIFANEQEAIALTGKTGLDVINEISKNTDLVCIKIGENGSWIKYENTIIKIEPVKTKAIDTTGAGDNYAAGILYGITHNMKIDDAAHLASVLAAKAVSKIGARLSEEELKDLDLKQA